MIRILIIFPAKVSNVIEEEEEIIDLFEDFDVADVGAIGDADEIELSHNNQPSLLGAGSSSIATETIKISADDDNDQEINDEKLHLREIGGEDGGDVDIVEEDYDDDDTMSYRSGSLSPYELLQSWTWQMNRTQRLQAAANLLISVSNLVEAIREKTQPSLNRARKPCAEAGAHAMKRARIVGATVVGASRRLPAIRAAEPFAIVVEEACEVMEPTLMSVLAIRSLHKLVLVGDCQHLCKTHGTTWRCLNRP